MNVEVVPLAWVNRVWDTVAPYIDAALEWSNGEYTVEHARVLVTTGQWLLLVATEDNQIYGAATMYCFNRPTDRVAFLTALGGPGITSPEMFDQFKVIAAAQGATVLEAASRESAARLWRRFGLEEKYRIVGVKL